MRVASFDIVFQEIPGEVTLALNLSGCPCHCRGCHSPHLWEDIGEPLNRELLDGLLARYGSEVTCVAFMGGDQAPDEVAEWGRYVRNHPSPNGSLKTANSDAADSEAPFDFVKLGPYVEALGGLKSPTTNQRLYKRVGNRWEDITDAFWRKSPFG